MWIPGKKREICSSVLFSLVLLRVDGRRFSERVVWASHCLCLSERCLRERLSATPLALDLPLHSLKSKSPSTKRSFWVAKGGGTGQQSQAQLFVAFTSKSLLAMCMKAVSETPTSAYTSTWCGQESDMDMCVCIYIYTFKKALRLFSVERPKSRLGAYSGRFGSDF